MSRTRHGRGRWHRSAHREWGWDRLRRRLATMDDRERLERLQRDLEQAAADVAQRIREVSRGTAG